MSTPTAPTPAFVVAEGRSPHPARFATPLCYLPGHWREDARWAAHEFRQRHGFTPDVVHLEPDVEDDRAEAVHLGVFGVCEATGAPILDGDDYDYVSDPDGVLVLTGELAERFADGRFLRPTYDAFYGLHPVRHLEPDWGEENTLEEVRDWWSRVGFEAQCHVVSEADLDGENLDPHSNYLGAEPPADDWLRTMVWSDEDGQTWASDVRPIGAVGEHFVALAEREWPAGSAVGAAAPAYQTETTEPQDS